MHANAVTALSPSTLESSGTQAAFNGSLTSFARPTLGEGPAHSDLINVLNAAKSVHFPTSRDELFLPIEQALASRGGRMSIMAGDHVEGEIIAAKEGFVINFSDPRTRVRDPRALVVADQGATSHDRFSERFDRSFQSDRAHHMNYLQNQELVVSGFRLAGTDSYAILVAPKDFLIFNYIQSEIMGFEPQNMEKIAGQKPAAVIYLNPESRHTHYNGDQVVIHDRSRGIHEIFANSLYPGPSCKKGMFGVLLELAERDLAVSQRASWTIAHAAIAVMQKEGTEKLSSFAHMGPSGSGKSEILSPTERGEYILGVSPSGVKIALPIPEHVSVRAAMDDFGLMKLATVDNRKQLVLTNIEEKFFIRTDGIRSSADEPSMQESVRKARDLVGQPLVFLSYDVEPNGSVELHRHFLKCSNPRVIVPTEAFPDFYNNPCAIDVFSFGLRAPLTTAENPSYGVLGIAQKVDWKQYLLWTLVCPRGDKNPSTLGQSGPVLVTEGEGSMRPFNVGSKIAVANAFYQLLHDGNADASFFVFPNQHVGAYKVQWPQRIIRNVIAAEGAAQFGDNNLSSENHPILGRTLQSLTVNGADVPLELLQPSTQAELGREGFLAGRKMLEDFFIQTLSEYLIPETHGRDDLPPIAIDPGLREVIETAIRDIRAQQPH